MAKTVFGLVFQGSIFGLAYAGNTTAIMWVFGITLGTNVTLLLLLGVLSSDKN